MTCRELIEMALEYCEGELPEEMCAHIREHLNCCPPCGHFYHSYQITIKVTRRLPPAPMPQSLHDKLNALLNEIQKKD